MQTIKCFSLGDPHTGQASEQVAIKKKLKKKNIATD